jgi:DNA ligase (NAD+)
MKTKTILRNPRGFAESVTLKELSEILRTSDYEYHDKNKASLPDEVYDILRDVYNERASKPYRKVGHVSSNQARRVKLPIRMGSLDKVKPGSQSLQKLLDIGGPYVVSDKEDGISLSLVYESGTLVKAYQRGDGVTGTDSSGVIPTLNAPKHISEMDLIVRVEFTMNDSTFRTHFSKETGGKFENARNGAGGLLNRNKPLPEISKVKCIAHEILKGKGAGLAPSKQFQILKSLGFNVVPHKKFTSLSEKVLTNLYKMRRTNARRKIDGIVVAIDKPYTRVNSKYPNHMFAFKMNSLEDSVVVKVKEVEWNVSRHGKFVPRVVIPPTKIGDVTVSYISGHNAFFIEHGYISKLKNKPPHEPRPINKGAEIRVVRSGDVIPYIVEVVKAARTYSEPEGKYETDGIDHYTIDKTDTQHVKAVTNFFTTIGVDGLKSSTVKKLIEHGYSEVVDIINATAADFEALPNFAHTSAVTLERNISKALKENATLPKLAAGSNIFGNLFGESRFTSIFESIPDALTISTSELRAKLKSVEGINTIGETFVVHRPAFKRFLKETGIRPVAMKKLTVVGSKAKGLKVLFTSVRDDQVKQWILANGGTLASSVKSANILLVKTPNATNNKIDAARQANIPVMTVDDFRSRYRIR